MKFIRITVVSGVDQGLSTADKIWINADHVHSVNEFGKDHCTVRTVHKLEYLVSMSCLDFLTLMGCDNG